MTLKTRAAVTAISSILILAGPAAAESALYVHGGFNSTTLEQTTTRNTGTDQPTAGPVGGPSITTTDQDTGASFYIAGGYQINPFPDSFMAVEIYYADENAETQNINSVKVTDVSLQSSYGVDLKLGQNVTDKFAVYGLLGIAQYDFHGSNSYTFAPPVDDFSDEETAFVYGGGVELAFNERWSTIAEVRIANDVDFDTPVDVGGIQSDDDFDFIAIRSGLKYKF